MVLSGMAQGLGDFRYHLIDGSRWGVLHVAVLNKDIEYLAAGCYVGTRLKQ